jgi:putative tryptophan/tyrosine transport system substrate-binding protein
MERTASASAGYRFARAKPRIAILLCLIAAPQSHAASIALIKSYDFAPYDAAMSGFVNACSNDIAEYNLDGEADGNARLVQEIKSDNPDLIVAIGVLAAQFARQELGEFAVLYVMVPKVQTQGLTGDNIGGISLDIPIEQQLDVYRSMVKDLNAIGVIFDPQRSGHFIEEARKAAELKGLTLLTREVTSRKQVPAALRALLREEQIDALWMIPDDTVVTPESFKFLLITSIEHDLPFLAASDIFVKVGALASLTPDYMDLGRQSCELANALTNGEMSLAGMNAVAPAKVNLAINLKTAKQIGLSIPEEVIESADVVYR